MFVSSDSIEFFIKKSTAACFKYSLNTDGSDSIEFLNDKCVDLWEISQEEVKKDASLLWNQVLAEDFDEMRQSVLKSAQDKSIWSHSWRIQTPSGKLKWVKALGEPQKSEDGNVTWTTFIEDITEFKQLEEDYNKITKKLSQTQDNIKLIDPAAAMAHELINSITVSLWNCRKLQQQLQREEIQDPKVFKYFETILNRNLKMADLISSLKSIFYKGEVSLQLVSLQDSINKAMDDLPETLRKNIDFKINVDHCPELYSDATALEIVFRNLFKNSLYEIEQQDHPWISITVEDNPDGFHCIVYKDSGKISEEIAKKLFAEAMTTKSFSAGTGIGLLLVQKIIERMKGRIWVCLNENNTTFKIQIPKNSTC
jgi:PAS domain S-box-containing protein